MIAMPPLMPVRSHAAEPDHDLEQEQPPERAPEAEPLPDLQDPVEVGEAG